MLIIIHNFYRVGTWEDRMNDKFTHTGAVFSEGTPSNSTTNFFNLAAEAYPRFLEEVAQDLGHDVWSVKTVWENKTILNLGWRTPEAEHVGEIERAFLRSLADTDKDKKRENKDRNKIINAMNEKIYGFIGEHCEVHQEVVKRFMEEESGLGWGCDEDEIYYVYSLFDPEYAVF